MKKNLTSEVKIALVAVATVVLLFLGMNFLKGLTLFSNDSTYYITFSNVKGLTKATGVFADGYRVGSVSGIEYDYDNNGLIRVEVDINPELRIPAGSKAVIESDLMGSQKVNILFANNPRERIQEGGTIEGVEDDGLMSQLKDLAPVVQNIVPKLDSIVTSLNAILANPAIAGILQNTEVMTANLMNSTSQLNTMLTSMNKQLPTLMAHANNTMANTEQLTDNLARVDVDATMAKVNRTLDNVESMTRALNDKEGTMGLLLHDKGLYNSLSATVSDADSLVSDLKAHPKRYVHFSIFGRKDK